MSTAGWGSGNDRPEVVVVVTTVADDAAATSLADAVVARHLAACAKRRAVSSTYRWQGEVERCGEVVIEMVTAPDRVDGLVALVAAEHPYELPELISWPVTTTAAYAQWVRAETRARP